MKPHSNERFFAGGGAYKRNVFEKLSLLKIGEGSYIRMWAYINFTVFHVYIH